MGRIDKEGVATIFTILQELGVCCTTEHRNYWGSYWRFSNKMVEFNTKYKYNIDKFSEREPFTQEYQGDIK